MVNNNFNQVLYVGIDAHLEEHTAVIANRFEEEKGNLNFENNQSGIKQFLSWLEKVNENSQNLIVGIEGGGKTRKALAFSLLQNDYSVYEVNPLYTKQRRDYGTTGDKSDLIDARLVVEVLTKKLEKLPQLTLASFASTILSLRKAVAFYEELTKQRARLKNQLKVLVKERELAFKKEEALIINLIIKEKRKELKRIKRQEQRLKKMFLFLLGDQGANLITLKGISTILAARISAHAGDINRFGNLNKFVKYAGIAPLEKSSGKSKRHQKNKQGNRKLNTTLYLVALNQLRWNHEAKRYFAKKVKEGKTKKQALRCLMKRSACIVYGMLRSGRPYQN